MKNKTTDRILMPLSLRNSSLAVIVQTPTEQDPFRALITEWLSARAADGLSPRTVSDYREKIYKFWWWWNDGTHNANKLGQHPRYVTVKELREFVLYLRTPMGFRWGEEVVRGVTTLSAASIAAYGRSVKVFFNWLVMESHIPASPFNRSIKFSVRVKDEQPIKTVESEDLAKLFAYLSNPDRLKFFDGIRDHAIIAFLLDTGVRKGELLRIQTTDFDFGRLRCKVSGKTGSRWVPFSPECRELLTHYKDIRAQFEINTLDFWVTVELNPLTYNGLSSVVRRIEKHTGVDFHAHQLRHTYATTLTGLGVGIADLARLMGHSKIETTMRYIHQNADRLGEVYKPISPLHNMRNAGRPRKEK